MCGMRDSSPEDHVTTAWRIILYIEHTIQLVRLTGKVITQKYIGQPLPDSGMKAVNLPHDPLGPLHRSGD